METLLASSAVDYTPFWILAAGVVFVIASIVKLRLHPFLGLTLGAVLVGILTPQLPDSYNDKQAQLMEGLKQKYRILKLYRSLSRLTDPDLIQHPDILSLQSQV